MSFLEHFSIVEDPRKDINVKHDFMDVLFLTVSAVMSGCEGWSDIELFGRHKLDWLRKYRDFASGIPVDDTIARIIRAIKPSQLNEAFLNWVNEIRQSTGQPQIAIDGKTLRHSYQTDNKHSALHSITAWSTDAGLVLAQLKSSGKKNEQAGVLELLDCLDIKGALITADAMSTQKKIVNKIKENEGDYLLSLKGNQSKLNAEVEAWFHKMERDSPKSIEALEEVDSGHGRIEVRRYYQLPVSDWIASAEQWAGLTSVIKVERERQNKSEANSSSETQYYISSLGLDIQRVASATRKHWEVENKAHWVLDMVFKEDDSRIRKDDGAENAGVIRRFCLNMARLHPKKSSMRQKLKMAAYSDDIRSELIFGIS